MKNIEIKNQESPICSQFWGNKNEEIESNENFFLKHDLPLARIKKLMRVEEDVKNIGGEVTPLFSKITQTFIEEVTIKALDKAYNRKKELFRKVTLMTYFHHQKFMIFYIS